MMCEIGFAESDAARGDGADERALREHVGALLARERDPARAEASADAGGARRGEGARSGAARARRVGVRFSPPRAGALRRDGERVEVFALDGCCVRCEIARLAAAPLGGGGGDDDNEYDDDDD